MLLEEGGGLDAVLGHIHHPPLLAQGVGHGDSQQRLILDDQQSVSADLHHDFSPFQSPAMAIMMTRNVVPRPTEDSTSIVPP